MKRIEESTETVQRERVELAVAQGALETTRRDYARLQRGLTAERTAQQSVSPVAETSDASTELPKSKNGKSDGHGAERWRRRRRIPRSSRHPDNERATAPSSGSSRAFSGDRRAAAVNRPERQSACAAPGGRGRGPPSRLHRHPAARSPHVRRCSASDLLLRFGIPKGVAVEKRQRVMHAVEGRDQIAVVRGLADGAVEAAIERDQHARVVLMFVESFEHAMEKVDHRLRWRVVPQSAPPSLEDLAHRVELEHLLLLSSATTRLRPRQRPACRAPAASAARPAPACGSLQRMRDLLLGNSLTGRTVPPRSRRAGWRTRIRCARCCAKHPTWPQPACAPSMPRSCWSGAMPSALGQVLLAASPLFTVVYG